MEHWREQEFLVVAQSLDGDYLAGTLEQTFVIPSSLYKEDIEQFDKQLIDFFAYENKEITSAILPKNYKKLADKFPQAFLVSYAR